ncbi:DUF6998 domain-containing protein [Brucella ciceri]|uniref:DUF6998 domain-containing protein n=1 Tax=Brucella TaxID=234 RepID=UPI003B987620
MHTIRYAITPRAAAFAPDGNLIGNLGDAQAADIFGIKFISRTSTGVDGHAPDGRSVQVKPTVQNAGSVQDDRYQSRATIVFPFGHGRLHGRAAV